MPIITVHYISFYIQFYREWCKLFLCVLMSVYQFTSYFVTAVCQLLINGYVMLCYQDCCLRHR